MLWLISYRSASDNKVTTEQVELPDIGAANAYAEEHCPPGCTVEDYVGTEVGAPALQATSPNGIVWQLTVTNTGTSKWVKVQT